MCRTAGKSQAVSTGRVPENRWGQALRDGPRGPDRPPEAACDARTGTQGHRVWPGWRCSPPSLRGSRGHRPVLYAQPGPARVCSLVGTQSRKAGVSVSEAGATLGPGCQQGHPGAGAFRGGARRGRGGAGGQPHRCGRWRPWLGLC